MKAIWERALRTRIFGTLYTTYVCMNVCIRAEWKQPVYPLSSHVTATTACLLAAGSGHGACWGEVGRCGWTLLLHPCSASQCWQLTPLCRSCAPPRLRGAWFRNLSSSRGPPRRNPSVALFQRGRRVVVCQPRGRRQEYLPLPGFTVCVVRHPANVLRKDPSCAALQSIAHELRGARRHRAFRAPGPKPCGRPCMGHKPLSDTLEMHVEGWCVHRWRAFSRD